MAIAKTVTEYLRRHAVPYTVTMHARTPSARQTANATAVAPEAIAKAVVLGDRHGCVMAVLPADRYLNLGTLNRKLRRSLTLIEEYRLRPMFRDCALGAIPPLGPAYGLTTVVDDHLVGQPVIFFEGGDHEELVRVSGEQFIAMLSAARYTDFTH